MDFQEKKQLLIEQLLNITDEETIERMMEIVQAYQDPIIGYHTNGDPYRRSDLIKDIDQAKSDYQQGNYYTVDELRKESEE